MVIIHSNQSEEIKIEQFPYRGEMHEVIGTSVKWLSKHGNDGHGNPEYGLRLFTIQPGGQIPIHNHFYHQTMYILTGSFECWAFDANTDELTHKQTCGPGTVVYVPSMEPHGMKNIEDVPGTFLCCICNVYDDESL
jgi:quercetin dioxygenase-like cupin family protein